MLLEPLARHWRPDIGSFFTGIHPATGEDATLVLPVANAEAMQVFLDHVAASRPPNVRIVFVGETVHWTVS